MKRKVKNTDKSIYQRYKFLILIVIFSFILMFPNLGNRYIDGDEAITAMLGQSILENGMPYAYNDNQLISQHDVSNLMYDTDINPRVTKENLWREQPWLYFYLEAGSFMLFGVNAFSARFPFALIGIFTIIFIYYFSKKITNNKRTAMLSALLLATSATFYLFARRARYFSMIMLFVLTTIYTYINLIDKEKRNRKNMFLFSLSSILLFHTNYGVFFGIIFGLTIHFLMSKCYQTRIKEALASLLLIFIFTFPWYYLTESFAFNTSEISLSFSYLFYVIIGFAYLLLVFGFPYLFLFFIPKLYKEKDKIVKRNYNLLFTLIISFILFISIHDEIPPTRYLVALLPIICLLNSAIIMKLWDKRKAIATVIVVLLIFTNLLLVFPFNFFTGLGIEQKIIKDYEKSDVPSAVQHMLAIRLPFIDYLYEITHNYDNGDEVLMNYLTENTESGETYLASKAGLSKMVMFYTQMNYVTEKSQTPDWILFYEFSERASPRGKEKEVEFRKFVEENYDLSKYEKILLNGSKIRFSEIPDPIYHKFKTTEDGIIEIYHLKK